MPIGKTILIKTLCRILFQLGLQCLQFQAVLSDLELIQGIRIQHHSHTHHIRHSRVHRSRPQNQQTSCHSRILHNRHSRVRHNRRIQLHHSRPQSQQTSCRSHILRIQHSRVHRSRRIRLHHSRPRSQQTSCHRQDPWRQNG